MCGHHKEPLPVERSTFLPVATIRAIVRSPAAGPVT